MHTSLFLVALMVPNAAPAVQDAKAAPALTWQDSYRTACKAGREQSKPLAVFIGSGPMGWKNFIEEGSLSEQTQKSLAKGYICVYIDRDLPAGKRLAEQFGAASDSGLVFSTRDGESQAFFHAGKLSAA